MDASLVTWVIGIAVAGAGAGFLFHGFTTRCPYCKQWWTRKLQDRREISRGDGYKTVTRTDVTRTYWSGTPTGKVTRQEQVHVIRVNYEDKYLCGKCNREWIVRWTQDVEG